MNSKNSLTNNIRNELLLCGYVPNTTGDDWLVARKEYSVTSREHYPHSYRMLIVLDLREHKDKIIRVSAYLVDANKYMDDFDVWVFDDLANLKKIVTKGKYEVINDVW